MKNDQLPNADIALCLSGGGLRATLFHLGLIKALRTHGRNGRGEYSGGASRSKNRSSYFGRMLPAPNKAAAEVLTQDILRDTAFKTMDAPRATSIIPKGSLEIWVSDRK